MQKNFEQTENLEEIKRAAELLLLLLDFNNAPENSSGTPTRVFVSQSNIDKLRDVYGVETEAGVNRIIGDLIDLAEKQFKEDLQKKKIRLEEKIRKIQLEKMIV